MSYALPFLFPMYIPTQSGPLWPPLYNHIFNMEIPMRGSPHLTPPHSQSSHTRIPPDPSVGGPGWRGMAWGGLWWGGMGWGESLVGMFRYLILDVGYLFAYVDMLIDICIVSSLFRGLARPTLRTTHMFDRNCFSACNKLDLSIDI